MYPIYNVSVSPTSTTFPALINITFSLNYRTYIDIMITDKKGNRVRRLVDGMFLYKGSSYVYSWNGYGDDGKQVIPGTYYITVSERFTGQGIIKSVEILCPSDTTPPVTTDNWTDIWTATSPISVTLTPIDDCSGIQWTKYCVDTANTCNPNTSGINVSITCASGSVCTQYVRYHSKDDANNTETVKSKRVRQDRLTPTTTFNFPSASSWQTANFAINISDSDAGSGLSSCSYRVESSADGTTWTETKPWTTRTCNSTTSATITVSSTGDCRHQGTNRCKVSTRATDLAGNTNTPDTRVFSIDWAPPSGGSISYTDGYYKTTNVSVSFTNGSDTGSGLGNRIIQRRSATLSGGVCGTYSAWSNLVSNPATSPYTDTTVSSGSCYQYQYLVYDNAGNVATWTTTNVAKVDSIAPTITNNQLGDDTWRSVNDGKYDVDFTDAGGSLLSHFQTRVCATAGGCATPLQDWTTVVSGINASNYTTDWQLLSSTWDKMQAGLNYVSVRVYDNAGNVTELKDVFYINKAPKPNLKSVTDIGYGNVLKVEWDKLTDANIDGYKIYRCIDTLRYYLWLVSNFLCISDSTKLLLRCKHNPKYNILL
jgi:hypothetical protein